MMCVGEIWIGNIDDDDDDDGACGWSMWMVHVARYHGQIPMCQCVTDDGAGDGYICWRVIE